MLNLGRMAAELAHLPRAHRRGSCATWCASRTRRGGSEAIGWERPTGVLILSGHFGNWELLVYAHGRRGHPVTMVHRADPQPAASTAGSTALRARAGTRLVRKHHAAAEVLRALREKQLLVLPFDQNSTRGLGVFVDFFGVPASTNAGHRAHRAARRRPRRSRVHRPAGTQRAPPGLRAADHGARAAPATRAPTSVRNTARLLGRVRGHGAALSRAVALGAQAVEDAPAGAPKMY